MYFIGLSLLKILLATKLMPLQQQDLSLMTRVKFLGLVIYLKIDLFLNNKVGQLLDKD